MESQGLARFLEQHLNYDNDRRFHARVIRICDYSGDISELVLSPNIDEDDPQHPVIRPFVFFMGYDGLDHLFRLYREQHPHFEYEFLLYLGICAQNVRNWVSVRKYRYAIVFVNEENCVPATWAHLFRLVREFNPELTEFVERHGAPLAATNLRELVRCEEFVRKYESYEKIECLRLNEDRERCLTPRRFLKTEKTLVDFFVLLQCWYGVNVNFRGDGFTYDDDGNRGSSEYFVVHHRWKHFQDKFGAELVLMDVRIPDEAPSRPQERDAKNEQHPADCGNTRSEASE